MINILFAFIYLMKFHRNTTLWILSFVKYYKYPEDDNFFIFKNNYITYEPSKKFSQLKFVVL